MRYTGYMDVVRSCASPAVPQYAWMLTHACDLIDHVPGFPRGGVFHPDRSYTFVGPSAGFVPGPLQPGASGTNSIEGIRKLRPIPGTTAVQCEYEEPLNLQVLAPIAQP